jgi:hypothetical protein
MTEQLFKSQNAQNAKEKLRAHNAVAPIWSQISRAYGEALFKPEHFSEMKPLLPIMLARKILHATDCIVGCIS